MADDDSSDDDDLLLGAPAIRSSTRRQDAAKSKQRSAVDAILKSSRQDFVEAERQRELQEVTTRTVERFVESSSAPIKKRQHIEPTQDGFFEVKDEALPISALEKKRRLKMIKDMTDNYTTSASCTIVFKVDTKMFYESTEKAVQELKTILQRTNKDSPSLVRALKEAIKQDLLHEFLHSFYRVPEDCVIPKPFFEWLFRCATSSGWGDMDQLGRKAYRALSFILENSLSTQNTLKLVSLESCNDCLTCWQAKHLDEKGKESTAASRGRTNMQGLIHLIKLSNILSTLYKAAPKNLETAAHMFARVVDLVSATVQDPSYRDTRLLEASRDFLHTLMKQTDDETKVSMLVSQISLDPKSLANSWVRLPFIVSDLIPYFSSLGHADPSTCRTNSVLNMRALQHCFGDDDSIQQDKICTILKEVAELEDTSKPTLAMQALAVSYDGLLRLKSFWEETDLSAGSTPERFCAIGQCSVMALISGTHLFSLDPQKDEKTKEYRTCANRQVTYRLLVKLGTVLDYLTAQSNRLSANDYFRRLNCWLMVFNTYRLDVLKRLHGVYESDDESTPAQSSMDRFLAAALD